MQQTAMARTGVSSGRSTRSPYISDQVPDGSDRDYRIFTGNLPGEPLARDDLKWYLVNKYRPLLVDKLSREDLEELQYYHRRQYDTKRGWDHEYQRKFVLKLQEYMHEEILKREIAGIKTLVSLMKPEDLENDAVLSGVTGQIVLNPYATYIERERDRC